jgi:hypothetical protein
MSNEENEQKWVNITVDSQILSTFMSCARKMDFVFNRHLIPIGGVSKAIEKGQLSHIGLAAYWRTRLEGGDYQEASTKSIDSVKTEVLKFQNLEREQALDVMQNLIEYFKFIQNQPWIPVFVEQHFKFIAYEEYPIRIILTGRIDLGLRNTTVNLIPIDHKSEAERWFYTQMSNQFKIYALACKTNILGVQRFGFQKTLEPKDKFKLELIPFDPDVLDEFRNIILPYWCKQLLVCNQTGYYPPNTTSCVHGHFKCLFSDAYNGGICNVSREVREQKLERYFTVGEEWNPENF